MAKTLTAAAGDGGRNRVRVGGLCLLSSFICVTVFLIDYTPIISFIFLSNHWLFMPGVGGSGGGPHSLPLPAHSAFFRWHLLPTHLHCVPITHTDSKSFVQADMHTHKLTQRNSHKLCNGLIFSYLGLLSPLIKTGYQSFTSQSNI